MTDSRRGAPVSNAEGEDGQDAALAEAQLQTELQEYLHVRQQRRRLFPRAALVGFLAGCAAVAFRVALAAGDALRNALVRWAHHFPLFGWIFPVAAGAAGAGIAVAMVRKWAPAAAGSGIPHLEAVLQRLRELRWRRLLPVKFIGGTLAIGGGLALGREGPTVQMGAAVGAAVSDGLKVGTRDKLTLMAAGGGAGLAAAFNAPLSGLIFVLEEVQKDFRPAVFGAAFIASAVSDVVARAASGQFPVFRVPSYAVPSLSTLPAFAILGVLAGLLGVVYNRTLIKTLDVFARVPKGWAAAAAAAVGAVAGLAAWFSPGSVGGGHGIAEMFLDGAVLLRLVPVWFVFRFALSMLSYGCGAPGGVFAPLLALGAILGLGVGELAHMLAPHLVPIPAIFAVVGMAAYFTAIVRAPLTGIVLILEMTGNYAQMLPLVVACFCAYIVAEGLNELPLYENLMERDLRRGGLAVTVAEPIVLELEVEPGAPFEGKPLHSLGLPQGCILVSCREHHQESVPTANTVLAAHTRVTAVISPEATDGLRMLRHGCEAPD